MLIFGGLADKDRTFLALDRVVSQNPWRAATWMIRPDVAILLDDPRYEVIRNRLGLTGNVESGWTSVLTRLHLQWPRR